MTAVSDEASTFLVEPTVSLWLHSFLEGSSQICHLHEEIAASKGFGSTPNRVAAKDARLKLQTEDFFFFF